MTVNPCGKRTRTASDVTEHRRQQLRAGQRRYEQTAKGKAAKWRYQMRRIYLSHRETAGVADTIAQAKAIQAHIKERKRAFKGQPSGEETQGAAAG